MLVRKQYLVGLCVLLALGVVGGLAFASDANPADEPASSPLFDATLQQAVDELDGKATGPSDPNLSAKGRVFADATQHYTSDANVWPECEFGFTRDLVQWPACHYTSDPNTHKECEGTPPWPTKDYTWDSTLWKACGPDLTRDPGIWCDPKWTFDPQGPAQCDPRYTADPGTWPWCNPRYTWDPALWPDACPAAPPYYTYDDRWPECATDEYTTDPYRWAACHYTSDPSMFQACDEPFPTQDYTSNPYIWSECPGPEYTMDPQQWPWCDPTYTQDPRVPLCEAGAAYTQDPKIWHWCEDPLYTSNPVGWPQCHYTSDPENWPACREKYPTKDYTWDTDIWSECGSLTQDANVWPWCGTTPYTEDLNQWPWCNKAWTSDPQEWVECQPGYTLDPDTWSACKEGLYTQEPAVWPACNYFTADARIWPRCHYTSDPVAWQDCSENDAVPTRDYTTDPRLWTECERAPDYTLDAVDWPECHYTSDPGTWSECVELADLGDAPDSTNHPGAPMTAYPAGGPPGVLAAYPTVFSSATGLPEGPKHWNPRADAWLGPAVTLENDADLLPDEDTVTNIDPQGDAPDRDKSDDGVQFPVPAPHCVHSVMTYTLTIPAGAADLTRYVNVWFDWTRDGDWADTPECPDGTHAPEWAVQNLVVPPLAPGFHVLQTPAYLPWNPPGGNIPETWMRISVAEQPAPTDPATQQADGRGSPNGYRHGETEDYYFEPECPKPMADFVWDPPTICPTTTVSFLDTSTNSPTSWSWDFGDSLGTSSLQNPTYTYSIAGVGDYDVNLKVSNVCGTDTVTKTLTVIDCEPQEPDYDIWLKDTTTDDGSVPSSGSWWLSPDIWVRNDGDCTQMDHQNPIPGTSVTICTRVRNRMTTTVTRITVNLYWAYAALGLHWPGSFGYVGTFTIPSLAGGAEAIRSIPWTVPNITGHFCLRARADAPLDPLPFGPDTTPNVDYVRNNNNIAQKNANIVDYPEVTACGFYSTTVHTDTVYFDAVNTLNVTTTVDIVVDSTDFPLGTGTLIVEPGSLWGRWSSLTNFDQSGPTLLPTAFPATMGGISLAPYETAAMTMTIGAEIDEDFVISVKEYVNSQPIGGIDYVRKLPDCIYLPTILRDHLP